MKKLILIALLAWSGHSLAQKTQREFQSTEHISKRFTLQGLAQNSVFALHNIWGDVKIEGYNGKDVVIEVEQTILADDAEALANAKRDVKLGFDQTADSIIAYTAEPYDTRPRHGRNSNKQNLHYIIKLNYTVKVPNGINLNAHTVNNGGVNVADVYGLLKVGNVNGSITIANAKGSTSATTVNGNVVINYLTVPPANCNYHTINGKIEVTYPGNMAANVNFKSFNGDFYTDFADAQALPAQAIKTENKNPGQVTFRLNKNSRISLNGGNENRVLNFETLNGNIYLKKS